LIRCDLDYKLDLRKITFSSDTPEFGIVNKAANQATKN
jgi:hypothetical protein